VKEIKITQGKVALVDDGDFELLNQWKWYARRGRESGNWRVERGLRRQEDCTYNYRRIKPITMAEQILGRRAGFTIDHHDRNPFNFQRSNLRWATKSQQAWNRMFPNRTGFKGVSPHRRRFKAEIRLRNGRRYLGLFPTAGEAAQAYNNAARVHFGEFACLNPV
jgi:hypothetical protein